MPSHGVVVDIGCGSGDPVARTLVATGCVMYGIDPSPTLLSLFRRRFPDAPTACEAAETSAFFGRRFDGAVAIGVLFLLSEGRQRAVIERVGRALHPGGHFLFSAPRQACRWQDSMTGLQSFSLGQSRYARLLANAGMHLCGTDTDSGGNHYLHATRKRE